MEIPGPFHVNEEHSAVESAIASACGECRVIRFIIAGA